MQFEQYQSSRRRVRLDPVRLQGTAAFALRIKPVVLARCDETVLALISITLAIRGGSFPNFLGLRGIEWANLGYEGPRKLCIC
jgi:hypothetical protein